MISESVHQFPLRIPEGLRARMKEMAETNRRSLNAEILFHLERVAFDPLSITSEADQTTGRGAA